LKCLESAKIGLRIKKAGKLYHAAAQPSPQGAGWPCQKIKRQEQTHPAPAFAFAINPENLHLPSYIFSNIFRLMSYLARVLRWEIL
jgi:hypothetical protein